MNPKISLDVTDDAKTSGTNLQIWKSNNSEAQQWLLKLDENGYVTFIARNSGLAIDVLNSKTSNGTNIDLATESGNNNQKFILKEYTASKTYEGIDVSSHNTIDWAKIASEGTVDFAIIRAGYGGDWENQDDSTFKANVAACEKYNIPYGTYLYSYAADIENTNKTGANAEAKHMIRLLQTIKNSNYSPTLGTEVFLDVEDKSVANVSKEKLTSVANYFCTTIEDNKYKCGIYASADWLNNHLNTSSLATKFDIWLAQWPYGDKEIGYSTALNTKPGYTATKYKYWQFTSSGSLTGITGRIDLDLGYDIFD
jgi:GH25 family lysozyme M1 (1,4-beta-N-acetylmuramidase)